MRPSFKDSFMRDAIKDRHAVALIVAYSLISAFISLSVVLFGGHSLGAGFLPMDEPLSSYTKASLLSVLAFPLIYFLLARDKNEKVALMNIWALKHVFTLVVGLFYEDRYAALDARVYYEQGLNLGIGGLFHWSLTDGTNNIRKIVKIISLICPSSYHSIKVVFSFLGFLGIVAYYRGLKTQFPRQSYKTLYFISLFPSVLFWSSILGKDSLIFMFSGIFFWSGMIWFKILRLRYLLLAVMSCVFISFLRQWMGFIYLAGFLTVAFFRVKSYHDLLVRVILLPVLIPFFVKSWVTMVGGINLDSILAASVGHFSNFAMGGSAGQLPFAIKDWYDFMLFLPIGMFSALFRPLPFEVNNLFGFVAGIENIFLLLASIVLLLKPMKFRLKGDVPLLFWTCSTVIIWALAYSFVSSANLGTGSRFRLQIICFFLSMFCILFKGRKDGKECNES